MHLLEIFCQSAVSVAPRYGTKLEHRLVGPWLGQTMIVNTGELVKLLPRDHEGGQVGSVNGEEHHGEQRPHVRHESKFTRISLNVGEATYIRSIIVKRFLLRRLTCLGFNRTLRSPKRSFDFMLSGFSLLNLILNGSFLPFFKIRSACEVNQNAIDELLKTVTA